MSQDQDPTVDLNMHAPKEPRSSPSGLSLASAPTISPGTLVNDRFKILDVLGKGAMGTVYRVEQVFIKKQFALKVLNGLAVSANTVRRFQNEAEAAARLDHANLAKAIDFGLIEGQQPFIVMELVQGETLAAHLKRKGKLDWQDALRIFVRVFDAMAHAHEQGVIHRDIKPSNIILVPSEDQKMLIPKVVDFGIAKLELDRDVEGLPLTKTGEVFGTPLYMSPEQCSGEKVDNRSDIYSLGCVLFETITGAPPFTGDTALETMMQHRISNAPDLKEASLGQSFPPTLDAVMRKLLAKEREDRYQNCSEAASDLTAVLQNKPLASTKAGAQKQLAKAPNRDGAKAPNTKPLFYAVMTLALMALIVAITLGIKFNAQPDAKVSPPSSDQTAVSHYESDILALASGKSMLSEYITSLSPKEDRFSFPRSTSKISQASELKPLRAKSWVISVDLNDHQEVSGDDVIQYLPSENLQTLKLRETRITDKGVKEISKRLSQLKSLDLTNDYKIDDIKPLSQLHMLSTLKVNGIGLLMHTWSTARKPSLGGLIELEVGYGAINDDSLPYVETLKSLQRLKLSGNQYITDKSANVLAHCLSLRDLDLSELQVSDNLLDRIQRLKLVRLDLDRTRVTKSGITRLLKNMPSLKYLNLNRTLTTADLMALRRQFPQCEIVTDVTN